MRTEIQHALRFVAEHIDRPMTVAEVAKAVGLSEFHLHRVFHATVGESLGRFITRRRLENAALRLAYEPTVSITPCASPRQMPSRCAASRIGGLSWASVPSRA